MDIWANLGWVVLGLVMLYYGAEWLVRGASALAVRMGISPLVVGLTVVAFGTSAPELVVSAKANLAGQSALALGNVVGSNICNICLVLGVAALIFPVGIERQVVRREMPILLVISFLFYGMMWNGEVAVWESALLALGIFVYVVMSLRLAKKEPAAAGEGLDEEVLEAAQKGGIGGVLRDLALVAVGVVVLVFGADFLVKGGAYLARAFGVSEAVIGLTLVAFGTSLPELATSVVAALKKEGDICVGNAVGSCIFNILAVIGLSGLLGPMDASALTQIDLWVMLGATIVLLPMMRKGMSLARWEGGLLLAAYLAYTAYLGIAHV
ncbi:MAG: calcium/sodium antiporter [Verrucomicrobiales bacterium]